MDRIGDVRDSLADISVTNEILKYGDYISFEDGIKNLCLTFKK